MAKPTKSQNPTIRKPPDQRRLHQIFDYNPVTGVLTSMPGRGGSRPWLPVGKSEKRRNTFYLRAHVDCRKYYVHQIIWAWMTGEWVPMVDHEDGDGLNNRWGNLRQSTQSQNTSNSRLSKANTSGFKGVVLEKGKWRAKVTKNYVTHHVHGYFATAEEAHAAYLRKAKELFGEFARAV